MRKFLGYFFLAGLAIYALQLALAAALVAMGISVVVGLIFRPKETVGTVAFLVIMGMLGKYPIPTIIFLSLVIVGNLLMPEKKAAKQ
jgi:hypothetical protein